MYYRVHVKFRNETSTIQSLQSLQNFPFNLKEVGVGGKTQSTTLGSILNFLREKPQQKFPAPPVGWGRGSGVCRHWVLSSEDRLLDLSITETTAARHWHLLHAYSKLKDSVSLRDKLPQTEWRYLETIQAQVNQDILKGDIYIYFFFHSFTHTNTYTYTHRHKQIPKSTLKITEWNEGVRHTVCQVRLCE